MPHAHPTGMWPLYFDSRLVSKRLGWHRPFSPACVILSGICCGFPPASDVGCLYFMTRICGFPVSFCAFLLLHAANVFGRRRGIPGVLLASKRLLFALWVAVTCSSYGSGPSSVRYRASGKYGGS